MQQALNLRPEPHWHRSLRPSFSVSSTSPWTKRRPRLTWVSEGKDFRRLRVMLKAGEVFDIAMFAHGTPPSLRARPIAAALR